MNINNNTNLLTSTGLPILGSYAHYCTYYDTGEFLRWTIEAYSDTWAEFNNTGDRVYGRSEKINEWREYRMEMLPAITNTSFLRDFQIQVGYYAFDTDPSYYVTAYLEVFITPGSPIEVQLFSLVQEGVWIYSWGNITLPTNAQIYKVLLYMQVRNADVLVEVIYEDYAGITPTITNYTILAYNIAPHTSVSLSVEGIYTFYGSAALEVSSEWGGFTSIALYSSWEKPNILWLNSTQFKFEGLYSYRYALRNCMGGTTYSSILTFRITYEAYPDRKSVV